MKSDKYKNYRRLSLRELQLLQFHTMKLVHEVCVDEGINYYMIGGTLLGAIRHKGFIPWDDDIDIAMMRQDFDRFNEIFAENFDPSKFFLQSYYSDRDFRPAMMRVCIKNTIQDLKSEYHHRNCKNTYVDIFPLDNVPDSKSERVYHSKMLRLIDRFIDLKLYHIYEHNSKFTILNKKIVSIILSIIPLKLLQTARIKCMTLYKDQQTECVASTVSKYGYLKQVMSRDIYGTPQLYEFEDTHFYGVEQYDRYLQHLFGKDYMKVPPIEMREIPTDVYIKEE